ncbi:MAG: acetoacetate--CoA ligase [Actinomycetes bacterium]
MTERSPSPPSPVWVPSQQRVADAVVTRFRRQVNTTHGLDLQTTADLHRWSVEAPDQFHESVWDLGVLGDRGDGPAFVTGEHMSDARFFTGASLNYAENLLGGAALAPDGDDGVAIVFEREDGVRRTLTWQRLRANASAFAAALRDFGVLPGDRVAAWMPNSPETVVAMLGTLMVGGVFTSTSPDFGVAGVLDRFGQVEPKVLVAADGYVYANKPQPRMDRLPEVVAGLPSLHAVVVVGELDPTPDLDAIDRSFSWQALMERFADAPAAFVPMPFDAPGFILYSSGTTGVPKCIVHRAAGLLFKHLIEQQLHCDIRPGDTVLYFTTCGWMMWNWLVSGLASGATIVLYDGSPFHPAPEHLWNLADELGVTFFGTSAKYLDAARKAGLRPIETHDLSALRTIASTGSPLVAEGFEYVYESVGTDVHLASISGGTDICGCFVAGDPTLPVWSGEIQGPVLGMAVDVYDEDGQTLRHRPDIRGELVCTRSFVSMPLSFWNDPGDTKYRAAYFERFPGVWAHGDFASWTEHGGLVIHGRSDATLNAGGVRIGTAEIYRQVERLDEVAEALAIGQLWDDDTRIVLFVRLSDGVELDDELVSTIKRVLRENCSPRHVPARIVAVTDLPRTRSGKLAELAVADVVHGREVRNVEALANPESLALFADLEPLQR